MAQTAPTHEEEHNRIWTVGISGERGALGRPKEWDGNDAGFEDFTWKFSRWLATLPPKQDGNNAADMLGVAARHPDPMPYEVLFSMEQAMARGIGSALAALVGGRALNIVRGCPLHNGFEMWRRLFAEYRPNTAMTQLARLDEVIQSHPNNGEIFSDWIHRWLIRVTETQRGKVVKHDVKTAVLIRRTPPELQHETTARAEDLADDFPKTLSYVMTWLRQ